MRNKFMWIIILWGCLVLTMTSVAKEQTAVDTYPPVVVKTEPAAGTKDVDPSLREVKVTFSKTMKDGNWSFVQESKETFPKIDGEIRFLKDHRTCVLPVRLKPGTTYVIWINSDRYFNFKETGNRPAVPYLLVFETD